MTDVRKLRWAVLNTGGLLAMVFGLILAAGAVFSNQLPHDEIWRRWPGLMSTASLSCFGGLVLYCASIVGLLNE